MARPCCDDIGLPIDLDVQTGRLRCQCHPGQKGNGPQPAQPGGAQCDNQQRRTKTGEGCQPEGWHHLCLAPKPRDQSRVTEHQLGWQPHDPPRERVEPERIQQCSNQGGRHHDQ